MTAKIYEKKKRCLFTLLTICHLEEAQVEKRVLHIAEKLNHSTGYSMMHMAVVPSGDSRASWLRNEQAWNHISSIVEVGGGKRESWQQTQTHMALSLGH